MTKPRTPAPIAPANSLTTPEKKTADAARTKKPQRFRDTGRALIFFVAVILFIRWFIFVPFKIPSGSMEPTLVGHEDYGDRIWTNQLIYQSPAFCLGVLGCALLLIGIGWLAAWPRRRSHSYWAVGAAMIVLSVAVALKAANVAADEPRRWDVVVFVYNTEWAKSVAQRDTTEKPEKKNYIKRLVGLPGETVVISGGDLFLLENRTSSLFPKPNSASAAGLSFSTADGKPRILRKPPELQAALWFLVSDASMDWPSAPTPAELESKPWMADVVKDRRFLAFPWRVEAMGQTEVEESRRSLRITGSAELHYAAEITNVYVKTGRRPFIHNGCPAVKDFILGEDGVRYRAEQARGLADAIEPYIARPADGVCCPNCQRILFPLVPNGMIVPDMKHSKEQFFYGGRALVGDLKLELAVESRALSENATLTLEVGSDRNFARWSLPLSAAGKTLAAGNTPGAHEVEARPLASGRHVFTLAYEDATVIATMNGTEIERRELEVLPAGAQNITPFARVTVSEADIVIRNVRLYRDLYHTIQLDGGGNVSDRAKTDVQLFREHDCLIAVIPQDHYFVLGDNSPSSVDGRVWGFVPRDEMVGRASFIWWPPSRWRMLK
jgi:signal peptidase I